MSRPVAALVAALALTAGCASAGHDTAPPSADPTGNPATISPTVAPMVTPSAAASTALGAGERAWAAFSQRGLPYAAWWTHLKPLLSAAARAEYVYDDPSKLPAMQLTGTIRQSAKAPGEPRYTAEVVVPTSKGTFRLDLERHTLRSPWLLYAIRFPRSVH